jgi:hypothetical protein
MTADFLVDVYIFATAIICFCLFLAVHELVPNRRLALSLEAAILAAAGVAIGTQFT